MLEFLGCAALLLAQPHHHVIFVVFVFVFFVSIFLTFCSSSVVKWSNIVSLYVIKCCLGIQSFYAIKWQPNQLFLHQLPLKKTSEPNFLFFHQLFLASQDQIPNIQFFHQLPLACQDLIFLFFHQLPLANQDLIPNILFFHHLPLASKDLIFGFTSVTSG